MMKIFHPRSALALLVACSSSSTLLVRVANAEEAETCGDNPYVFKVNGEPFGSFTIADADDGDSDAFTVVVNIENQDLNQNNLMLPYVTEIRVEACCQESAEPNCATAIGRYHDENEVRVVTEARISVQEPQCADGVPVDIKVSADVEEPGGVAAFNAIFPPGGAALTFTLYDDEGFNVGSSFFDATFASQAPTPEALWGKRFDGWCVDILHPIEGQGTVYDATAYSFLNVDWNSVDTPPQIGNIQRVDQIDAVAWCINNYIVGEEYEFDQPCTTLGDNSTLDAFTMQLVIWYIVDDQEVTADGKSCAELIGKDCIAKGQGFVPGCNDNIPLIVVPDDETKQNLYVQTTFAQLGLECDGATGSGDAEAICDTGGTTTSTTPVPPTTTDDPITTTSKPGTQGDPHFKTHGGEMYDFHGGCDLVLIDNPSFMDGLGMLIHIRTKIETWWSFVESSVVRIGDETVEITGGKKGQWLFINGIANEPLEDKKWYMGKVSGLHVRYRQDGGNGEARIYFGNSKSKQLLLRTFGTFVKVMVDADGSDYYLGSQGLLGRFPDGKRVARDGETFIEDVNAFGQEWQVKPEEPRLFQSYNEDWIVSANQKCAMPTETAEKKVIRKRRLAEGIPRADAEKACAHLGDAGDIKACIFDVISTQDLTMAASW